TNYQLQGICCTSRVDRDLGEAVRILVPEGLAGRDLGKDAGVLQQASGYRESGLPWQQVATQPRHSVAIPVDIDNFGQIVGPIAMAAGLRGARLMVRVFAAGEPPRNRGKKVAPVKARRQRLRAP